MVKMEALVDLPMRSRWRSEEQTSKLSAGDQFEVPTSDVTLLTKTKWAKIAEAEEAPSFRRRKAPEPQEQHVTSEPDTGQVKLSGQTVAQEQSEDPHANLTVSELREQAEAKGIELPSGYVKREDLIELLSKE